ncbi:MAG: HAD family hydrolase [Candidatus Hydrogenedens sp.]
MTEKLILFDFDGVIADSFEIFFREFTSACTEMGFDRLNSKVAFLNLFEGNLLFNIVKAGFPPWKLRELFNRFQPRIAKANDSVSVFDGIREMLAHLSAKYPVYIISSNLTEAVQRFLVREKIDTIQDVLGADVETSKVKKIKRVWKKHPESIAYYIGDTSGDVYEGKEAGAITIAVTWGWHEIERLIKAKPHYLVHSPEELEQLLLSKTID